MYEYYYKTQDFGMCLMSCEGEGEEAIIPTDRDILIVADDLFKGHKELVRVEFPDSIIEIGGFLFDGCENLKEVKLPANLKDFWQYAMTRCGIEEIEIPGSVERIASFTFNQCNQLTEVRINEGTRKILPWAFKDCANLTDVYLPSTIKEISDKAFEGCPNVVLHRK
ncbi:leucine-rich repeat protein [Acetobacterium paludosum]|uniref:Leucine-rich repeat protein n=1 Tax=Acetobacterium paludosum TaxID=52693 RepID=A0A923HTI5_9FIRM|nr:leucine-rich repeat domain-containing protein [Acetobacterium paludosum]MBC3886917.1 leucine-rich repeat protein [Acetobacterium paludosum]